MLDFLKNHWRDGVEILILAWLVYYGYLLLHVARGARILLGLVMAMLGLIVVSAVFKLEVLLLVTKYLFGFVALALVVIFQPEMRRAVVELGSRRFWRLKGAANEIVEVVCDAMQHLSNRRFGAIFAISRDMDLADHAQTGVVLDAAMSTELIATIFHPKTALHDGGMILKDGRIHSAGCVFPVSHREFTDRSVGLRHRAGVGISEETDAIALIVSEETGQFSICRGGHLERDVSPQRLKKRLAELMEDSIDDSIPEETGSGSGAGRANVSETTKPKRADD